MVSTIALSRIISPSSRLIHRMLAGHHSSRNFLLRVIKISANWIGSSLGVYQSMKLTSPRWKYEGKRWIHHAKSVFRNQHRGCRGIG
jgi:hypothetical protein